MAEDIDFQTVYFADFEQFKNDIHFANFGQANIDPSRSFLVTLNRSAILLSLGKTYAKNNPKIKNHA